ncbi:MAG: flippase-like domain-containing protein [Anaerolineaceae bacterium]|nr:MAG: flippase-like domain-containing protein [Anaerolineaceae bacterium]
MIGRSRRSILRIIGTVLALFLLVYWLSQQGWDQILAAIRRIPIEIFVLIFGIMMISRVAVATRWYILLRSAHGGINLGHALRLTFAGLFASNFLPTTIGGDVVRLAGGMNLKLDSAMCAASLIADRVVGVVGMATLLPVGLYHLWNTAPLSITHVEPTSFAMVVLSSVGAWTRNIWGRVWEFIQRVLQALMIWIRKPRALLGALIFTWIHMFCLFITLWLLLNSLGEEMNFWSIGGLWSIVYFVTLLPFSINGLGIQEVTLTFFFANIGGISLESGLTLAILIRTLMMLASVPGIAFLPMILSAVRDGHETELSPEASTFKVESQSES